MLSWKQCAVVESVKTASDLYSPIGGKIVAVNESLSDSPEQINEDPYNAWIFCVQTDNLSEMDELLDADGYQEIIEK